MAKCLPIDSPEPMCMEKGAGRLEFCMKPKGHAGDRHGFDLGFMSSAWGYVEEGEVSDA